MKDCGSELMVARSVVGSKVIMGRMCYGEMMVDKVCGSINMFQK